MVCPGAGNEGGGVSRRVLALQDLKTIIKPTTSLSSFYYHHTLEALNPSDKTLLAGRAVPRNPCPLPHLILVHHWPGAQQERTEELL